MSSDSSAVSFLRLLFFYPSGINYPINFWKYIKRGAINERLWSGASMRERHCSGNPHISLISFLRYLLLLCTESGDGLLSTIRPKPEK